LGVTRELGVLAPPKPIGLTINYLRFGRALDSYAKVSIVKQGRRVVAFETQAWQDDPTKPIASAFGHFMLRKTPACDIDTAYVDSLKVLDPEWPIREADVARPARLVRFVPAFFRQFRLLRGRLNCPTKQRQRKRLSRQSMRAFRHCSV
jgi:hypothetical protein